MVEFYRSDMPVDPSMGTLAEALRTHPKAARSKHPILSFTGINAKPFLDVQTIQEPLPSYYLTNEEGWVLLLGVDQTANTSIYYGEKLAGRKQFVRWALTLKELFHVRVSRGVQTVLKLFPPSWLMPSIRWSWVRL